MAAIPIVTVLLHIAAVTLVTDVLKSSLKKLSRVYLDTGKDSQTGGEPDEPRYNPSATARLELRNSAGIAQEYRCACTASLSSDSSGLLSSGQCSYSKFPFGKPQLTILP